MMVRSRRGVCARVESRDAKIQRSRFVLVRACGRIGDWMVAGPLPPRTLLAKGSAAPRLALIVLETPSLARFEGALTSRSRLVHRGGVSRSTYTNQGQP